MARSSSPKSYGNDSISSLKGADRVRKRPAVIFGSDGLEGCEHAVFEILSNAIDEAREGHGNLITVTRYEDKSIEVEDFGRGCPVDWNRKSRPRFIVLEKQGPVAVIAGHHRCQFLLHRAVVRQGYAHTCLRLYELCYQLRHLAARQESLR